MASEDVVFEGGAGVMDKVCGGYVILPREHVRQDMVHRVPANGVSSPHMLQGSIGFRG